MGGIVDEYTTDGTFIKRLIDDQGGTHLMTPWGLAIAPAGWGKFGGDLLVGNNDGDGTINAYTLGGVWQGQLTLNTGAIFSEGELWGMTFGNGGGAGSPNVLYFVAGLDGATNGLLGSISLLPVPEPSSAVLGLIAAGMMAGGCQWRRPVHGDFVIGGAFFRKSPRFSTIRRAWRFLILPADRSARLNTDAAFSFATAYQRQVGRK